MSVYFILIPSVPCFHTFWHVFALTINIFLCNTLTTSVWKPMLLYCPSNLASDPNCDIQISWKNKSWTFQTLGLPGYLIVWNILDTQTLIAGVTRISLDFWDMPDTWTWLPVLPGCPVIVGTCWTLGFDCLHACMYNHAGVLGLLGHPMNNWTVSLAQSIVHWDTQQSNLMYI